MEIIKLKGNTNRGIHYLSPVTPVEEHPDERWYKFITQYPYRIFNDIKTKLPHEIQFSWGPTLTVGETDPQIGMTLKEICPCINNDDIGYILIFDYDISGNEETGTVSQ